MPIKPCCPANTIYTVRRYDADGKTRWIRDYRRDSNVDPNLYIALTVCATDERVYVAGPLIGAYAFGAYQSMWNVVCYDARNGARIDRFNVWDRFGSSPQVGSGQYFAGDICLGQNGLIGVLTAAANTNSGSRQTVFTLTQDLQPVSRYDYVYVNYNEGYERIEIDSQGGIHLSALSSEIRDTAGRLCAWPIGTGAIVGGYYPDPFFPSAPLPYTGRLALRQTVADFTPAESSVWEAMINDTGQLGQEVLETGIYGNGDILAAGNNFGLNPTYGAAWGRFTASGSPIFVGSLPIHQIYTAHRISAGSGYYFVATPGPGILCRDGENDSHYWAHAHQEVSDLYAVPSGGAVTVGMHANLHDGISFIQENQL